MLATGVRTMIGMKVFGNDLDQIQKVSQAGRGRGPHGAWRVVVPWPTRSSAKAIWKSRSIASERHGMAINVGDVQDVIEVALGGKPITTTVEGRERYPVRIRYARDARTDEEQIKNLLINAAGAGGGIAGKSSSGMGGAMNGGDRENRAARSAAANPFGKRRRRADRRRAVGDQKRKRHARAPTFNSTSTRPICSGLSNKPSGRWHKKSSCPRACIWNGADSSKTSSAPIEPCGGSCRWC